MLQKIHGFIGVTVIAAAFFLGFADFSRAASYYIDYSAGSDSSTGADTNNAWQHCPGDPAASGKPAAAVLNPGDAVFFKGGVAYNFTGATGISLNWNGATSSPITYDGNSAGNWGTGRAVFTCAAKTYLTAFGGTANQSLSFRNLEIGPLGGGVGTLPADGGSAIASAGAIGIYFGTVATNIVIDSCYFHELGYWQNTKPNNSSTINGFGVFLADGSNSSITNCEFTKIAIPCEIGGSVSVNNVEIVGCYFHDYMVWAIDFPVNRTGCARNNVNFHNNVFRDTDWAYDANHWAGYGGQPHCDGIFDRTDATGVTAWSDGNSINFYNNTFFDSTNNAAGGTACMYLEIGPSANIYNNIFYNKAAGNGLVDYWCANLSQTMATQVRILNNTFLNNYVNDIYLSGEEANNFDRNWNPNANVLIENNIYYDLATGSGNNFILYFTIANPVTGAIMMNYDLYKSFNRDGTFATWPSLAGELALTPTKFGGTMSSFGWETNGVTSDPLFVSLSTYNVHLQTNSPAIGAGVNLTSLNLPGLLTDKDGNPRPATGPWTIGAYQVAAAAIVTPPPPPVKGLHIVH